MTLSEKVAYLKGVAEGLSFDPEDSAEGKLISIMMDILEHIALNQEEIDDSVQSLSAQLDDIEDSMCLLEDCIYDEDEDEDWDDEDDWDDDEDDDAEEALAALEEDGFFELECPTCGDTLVVDKEVLASGTLTCPGCDQSFEIALECEEEDDEEEDD